jgi:hypothetical protein
VTHYLTRDYLDLRIGEVRTEIAGLRGEMLSLNADTLKWIFGALGAQTLAIRGGVAGSLSYSVISDLSR